MYNSIISEKNCFNNFLLKKNANHHLSLQSAVVTSKITDHSS